MTFQSRRCCAVRIGRLAKSLIKRGERMFLITQSRIGLLRFLRRIVELDPGRCKLRVELFRFAPEGPKTLEDVFCGLVGRCRLRKSSGNRLVERPRVFACNKQVSEA